MPQLPPPKAQPFSDTDLQRMNAAFQLWTNASHALEKHHADKDLERDVCEEAMARAMATAEQILSQRAPAPPPEPPPPPRENRFRAGAGAAVTVEPGE